MILIKNTQRRISVNTHELERDAQTILDALGYQDFDLGIWLTTNKTIQHYNKTYRKKDKPTDILSFSHHPDLKAGEKIKPTSEDDKSLGDLVISVEYVQKDAERLGVTLKQRLKALLVHGVCHLLGYDHEKDSDYSAMQRKETSLLKLIT